MAVYERTYKPYTGGLTDPRTRFLILPRYCWRDVAGSRLFIAFLVACFIVPLGAAVMIYLPHNASFLQVFVEQLGGSSQLGLVFDSGFFFRVLSWQGLLGFFLVFLAGPSLIAADLRNNALPLYLARPFSRWEYVAGKLTLLVALLSAITWVPLLLLFGLQAYLTSGWLTGHWRIGGAIVLGSTTFIVVLSLVGLAVSAYAKWKSLARLGLLLVFVVGALASAMFNTVLRTHWGNVFNLLGSLFATVSGLFGLSSGIETPLPALWAALAAVCAVSLMLLARKLRAYEVVRS